MSLLYQYFLQQSGLSEEAADLHYVTVEQVKAQATSRIKAPGSMS